MSVVLLAAAVSLLCDPLLSSWPSLSYSSMRPHASTLKIERKTVRRELQVDTAEDNDKTPADTVVPTTEHEHYVTTCERQLMIASSQTGISQTAFSAFVTRYCRDSVTRGPSCSNVLLLFQDLPPPLQLSFVEHSTHCSADDSQQQCLKELNAAGGLFYIGTDAIPSLCASTFDVLVTTNLLQPTTSTAPTFSAQEEAIAPTNSPIYSQPLVDSTASKTPTPRGSASPIEGSSQSNGLSIGAVLGIAMTCFFAFALAAQFLLLKRRRQAKPPSDDPALHGDESVSSENSQQLTPVAEPHEAKSAQDDCSATSPTGSWLGKDIPRSKNRASSVGSRGRRKTPRITSSKSARRRSRSSGSRSRSSKDHSFTYPQVLHSEDVIDARMQSKTTKRRFSYPQALVTEHLSQDNPVHIRKRFTHRKGSSFSFDDDDCNRTVNLTPADDSIPTNLPAMFHVVTNVPVVEVHPVKAYRARPDKENAKNRATCTMKYASNELQQRGERANNRGSTILGQHHLMSRRHRGWTDLEAPTNAENCNYPDSNEAVALS